MTSSREYHVRRRLPRAISIGASLTLAAAGIIAVRERHQQWRQRGRTARTGRAGRGQATSSAGRASPGASRALAYLSHSARMDV